MPTPAARYTTEHATAPSAWAAYFINGDASGLEDGTRTLINIPATPSTNGA